MLWLRSYLVSIFRFSKSYIRKPTPTIMEGFLSETKSQVENLSNKPVLVVLGNEACDLDSAVSSVVYAFYLVVVQCYPGRTILPVLNIPRSALHLRTEVVHTFKKENISLESLICKDEIPLQNLYDRGLLELILVDQNVLRASDKKIEPAVVEIIDHHKQEYEPREKLQKVLIEPVGSCATLITERILQNKPDVLSSQIAMLLYSAILVDTSNLSEVTKRATPKDKDIIEELEKALLNVDRKGVFEEVQKAKDSVEGFTVLDLLQKDQKIVSVGKVVVAFSTLVTTLQDFVNKFQDTKELGNYCSENSINVLILLNSIITGEKILREVAVYSSSEAATSEVCKILVESKNPDLALKDKTLEKSPVELKAFTQGNPTFTRKAVLPLVVERINTNVDKFEKLFSDN